MFTENRNFDPHAAAIAAQHGDVWGSAPGVAKFHRYDENPVPKFEFTPPSPEEAEATRIKVAHHLAEVARKQAEFDAIISGASVER